MKEPDRAEMRKDGWHYYLGHREVSQAEYEAVYPPPPPCDPADILADPYSTSAVTTWRKPVHSIAMGVHPDQIEEAKAHDRKLGLGETEYDKDGSPVLRNRGQKRDRLKAYGMIDRDSYAGY